jgi:hypothetical protein
VGVYLTSGLPIETGIDCAIDSSPGFVKSHFETTSKLTLGESEIVSVHPDVRMYSISFAQAKLSEVGAADGELVFSFAHSRSGSFTEFARVPIRIYVILGTPSLPWVASPDYDDNPHGPWLKALEVAARWARGARTRDQAASLITQAVFTLGLPDSHQQLRWEGGFPRFCTTYTLQPWRNRFTIDRFYLSDFLRMLERKGDQQPVNCNDIATAVCTFSNLLGCNLSLMSIGTDRGLRTDPTFKLRSVWPLGNNGYTEDLLFCVHQVAWSGSQSRNGLVYDACLAFDEGGKPAPVCGLRFGDAADKNGYLNKLTWDAPFIIMAGAQCRAIAPLRYRDPDR